MGNVITDGYLTFKIEYNRDHKEKEVSALTKKIYDNIKLTADKDGFELRSNEDGKAIKTTMIEGIKLKLSMHSVIFFAVSVAFVQFWSYSVQYFDTS